MDKQITNKLVGLLALLLVATSVDFAMPRAGEARNINNTTGVSKLRCSNPGQRERESERSNKYGDKRTSVDRMLKHI
jgi:hypothetical protein